MHRSNFYWKHRYFSMSMISFNACLKSQEVLSFWHSMDSTREQKELALISPTNSHTTNKIQILEYWLFQPMIQYINKKDIYGPFMSRQEVYLPHSAEVTSDKYTNMSVSSHPIECFFKVIFRRYQDKSSAKHNLDDFLKNAYSKQMKELNGTTG